MNDLVAGFLKFRETGYQERTELFHQLAHTQSPRVEPSASRHLQFEEIAWP